MPYLYAHPPAHPPPQGFLGYLAAGARILLLVFAGTSLVGFSSTFQQASLHPRDGSFLLFLMSVASLFGGLFLLFRALVQLFQL